MITTLITAIVVLLGLCLLGWVAYSLYNDLQTKKNPFGIAAGIIIFAVGVVAICWIASNCKGFGLGNSSPPAVTAVAPAPVPPTPHELVVQKQLEQEARDIHHKQMALSDAQAAALKADRAHIEKQREQELKAQKRDSQLAAFQRFTEQSAKTAENGLKLLEKISKQEPAKVINVITNLPQVIYTTSAPPNITFVATNHNHATFTFTNVNNVAVSNHNPIVVHPSGVVIQPVPVTLTLTSTATVSSGTSTGTVVAPKPAAPAPAKTNAPPAPQAPVKVKAPKAPAAPAVAPTNTQPAKATAVVPAPKAPAFKAGRVLVKHVNTVTLKKGAKDWWGIGLVARKLDGRESKGGQVITREYTLSVDVKTQEDLAVAQSALDLFLAHKAKELADNDDYVKDTDTAQQANLAKLFNVFVSERSTLNALSGMNPEIKFKVLPGPTGT